MLGEARVAAPDGCLELLAHTGKRFFESEDLRPMEYLYIIAATNDGPCKIGKALDVQKRLGQIQTGNPQKLRIVETFKLRGSSLLAESLCHWVLEKHKTPSLTEWFDVDTNEAKLVVKTITRKVAAVNKDDVILQDVHGECMLADIDDWHEFKSFYVDEDDDDFDDRKIRDFPRMDMISTFEVKALMLAPDCTRRFTFNDFARSYAVGYPKIKIGSDEGYPGTTAKVFKQLLPSIEYLDEKGLSSSISYVDPWIFWSHGRDATGEETKNLVQIWNDFVPHWNRIPDDGLSEPERGVDDKVDGVELYTVPSNAELGHGSYICFENESFRITLKLPPKIFAIEDDFSFWGTGRKVSATGVVGHVAPCNPDYLHLPFDTAFAEAILKMDADLKNWLSLDEHKYPKPRPETKYISNFKCARLAREISIA
jgi:Meiotically up-regulated gene 113